MATINMPNDIIFPLPQNEREALIFNALQDYFTQLKQTFLEIESKLP